MTTSTTSATNRLADGVALFERSAAFALEGLSGITDTELGRPTPCPDWDLRALLLHLADATDALIALITTGELSFGATPPQGTDAVAAVRERTQQLLEDLRSAVRRDPHEQHAEQTEWATNAAYGGAIEFAAHGWDARTARGIGRQFADSHAIEVLELAQSLISDESRFPQFGQPVRIPATATPSDRLIAFLGRDPATR